MSYRQCAYRLSIRLTTGSARAVKSTLLPTRATGWCIPLNETMLVSPPMTDHEDDERWQIDGIRELRERNRARKEQAETENFRSEHRVTGKGRE